MKKENNTRIILVVVILLIIDMLFMFYNNFENKVLSDSIVRLLYSVVIIIMIYAFKFNLLKPRSYKAMIFALPALLVAINNFPFVAYLSGNTTFNSSTTDVYYFILQVISTGLFEELIFRGLFLYWMLDLFKDKKHAILKAMIISSLIFGFVHLFNIFAGASIPMTLLQMLYSTLTGLMWSATLILTRNIWLTALMHAIYNFAGLFFPTLGSVTGQWDIWTVTITIVLSISVAFFYLYHILKIKTYKLYTWQTSPYETQLSEDIKQ